MAKEKTSTKETDEDRRNVVDRRLGLDRRRGPGRRRSDDRKSAEEGNMTDEQFEFLMAIDEYKRKNSRPFPTWTEVLEVIKALGYRKVADPQSLAAFKKQASTALVVIFFPAIVKLASSTHFIVTCLVSFS